MTVIKTNLSVYVIDNVFILNDRPRPRTVSMENGRSITDLSRGRSDVCIAREADLFYYSVLFPYTYTPLTPRRLHLNFSTFVATTSCIRARSHLDDLPGLHGQRGEVSTAVDRDALPQDGVQPLHLIPRQHADPPTLPLGTTGGHGDRNGTERDVHGESVCACACACVQRGAIPQWSRRCSDRCVKTRTAARYVSSSAVQVR